MQAPTRRGGYESFRWAGIRSGVSGAVVSLMILFLPRNAIAFAGTDSALEMRGCLVMAVLIPAAWLGVAGLPAIHNLRAGAARGPITLGWGLWGLVGGLASSLFGVPLASFLVNLNFSDPRDWINALLLLSPLLTGVASVGATAYAFVRHRTAPDDQS